MAKDYMVREPAIKTVFKFLDGIIDIDGVAPMAAWPKALRLARRKDWALNALLKHAVTGRCGGNADAALDDLWGRLGNDAYQAYSAEIAAGKFDRHGNERQPVSTAAIADTDMPMLMRLGAF